MIPSGTRPQRDDPRRRRREASTRRSPKKARCWCDPGASHDAPDAGPSRDAPSHYPAAPCRRTHRDATRLSVLVDNEPGVLARVIGLFSGRGYNIESLTVSETEHEKHLSRITIVTRGTPMVIEQIKNQLERLVPIHRVVDMTVAGPRDPARARDGEGARQGRRPRRGAAPRRRLPRPRHRRQAPRASCSRSPARPTRSRASSP